MSERSEKLQDAIGMIKDEYIEEAHGDSMQGEHEPRVSSSNLVQIPRKGKRGKTSRIIAVAASVVLALGVGALAVTGISNSGRSAMTLDTSKAPDDTAMESTEGAYYGATDGESATPHPGTNGFATNKSEGEAHLLTAGEWNDNDNWPFFTNLVNSGAISFPVFGLDPTHRVKVNLVDSAGNPVRGEQVILLDASGDELWRGTSDKDGVAYLFYGEGQTPASVQAGGVSGSLEVAVSDPGNQQGTPTMRQSEEVTLTVASSFAPFASLQVMFIVDTTGSMSDEIAYLQKDFSSIAEAVGNDGVEYSVNFYRDRGDEYVTRCNGFTDNIGQVQSLLNAEYADGGGDMPEAVAEILDETITNNEAWRADCNKVAFLIFDAPPHEGYDAQLKAAVRSAAARGIRLVPVVASNADRDTELFGRALSIMTGASYVFLTDDSGVGESHLEPIIGDFTVEPLHDVIVRIINSNR